MSNCGLALFDTEMRDFKHGDLLTFWGEDIFLVISSRSEERQRVKLELLNLFTGYLETYEQVDVWYLAKVTL